MHHRSPFFLRAGIGLFALACPAAAEAASVTLAWDPNPEPDVLGYKVYYDSDMSGPPYDGTGANEGPSPVDVPLASLADPNAPTITLTGLPSCVRFYLAATAYNAGGESDYSGEVDATILATPNPVSATPGSPAALLVQWSGLPTDDDGSIESYRIQYDTDASGEPYQGAGSPVDVTSFDAHAPLYVLRDLAIDTTYYLVVEAICPDGTTKISDEVTGVPTDEDAASPEASDEAGCGCRMPAPRPNGSRSPSAAALLAALGLVTGAGLRRHRLMCCWLLHHQPSRERPVARSASRGRRRQACTP
jgi:hypothetical protein